MLGVTGSFKRHKYKNTFYSLSLDQTGRIRQHSQLFVPTPRTSSQGSARTTYRSTPTVTTPPPHQTPGPPIDPGPGSIAGVSPSFLRPPVSGPEACLRKCVSGPTVSNIKTEYHQNKSFQRPSQPEIKHPTREEMFHGEIKKPNTTGQNNRGRPWNIFKICGCHITCGPHTIRTRGNPIRLKTIAAPDRAPSERPQSASWEVL